MMRRNSYKKTIFLCLLIPIALMIQTGSGTACSVITTSSNDAIYLGYNEDRNTNQFDQITYIKFHKEVNNNFAYMEVTAESPTVYSLRTGMNEFGVTISGNGLSATTLNSHPQKTYSYLYQSIYQLILQKTKNITEVINLVNDFNFGPSMAFQIHVADKYGNAIVVSPGPDREIIITQKESNYLISTNMHRDQITKGVYDYRNDAAEKTLSKYSTLDKESVKTTLQRVTQDSYEGTTYYSVIYDITNGMAYFYLMHNFNNEYSLNVTQGLLNGDSINKMVDFFPNGKQILDDTYNAMVFQETMTNIARLLAVILVIVLIGLYIYKLTKIAKDERDIKQKLISISSYSIILLYGMLLILLSSVFIPPLLLTNFIWRMIDTGIIIPEFAIYVMMIVVMIIFLGWKRYKDVKNPLKVH